MTRVRGVIKGGNNMWTYNQIQPSDELMHYGIPGMKWGHRKTYHSTGIRSAVARRSNKKVDKSFKKWNENSKKRENAIELGKKANLSRLSYENDKKNKDLKRQYKADNKAYKKAVRKNTTYRKGQIKNEVGSDLSRKYLSNAKKVRKQLDADPSNKQLKKQYNSLMSKHDIERAKARRAPKVAAKRSSKKAAIKRNMTMTVAAVATTAAISAGAHAANRYLNDHKVTVNGRRISFSKQNIRDIAGAAKKIKDFMGYF